MIHQYDYARPGLTADLVIFHDDGNTTKILLIKRRNDPYKDYWALPGGFVEEGESLEQAAMRELKEETGITDVTLRQVAAFSDPHRDPRGWTVSVAFSGWVSKQFAEAGDDAKEATWFPLGDVMDESFALAFDHHQIIDTAFEGVLDSSKGHNE
jgi:8-oxo-dGTP diphosphatase